MTTNYLPYLINALEVYDDENSFKMHHKGEKTDIPLNPVASKSYLVIYKSFQIILQQFFVSASYAKQTEQQYQRGLFFRM